MKLFVYTNLEDSLKGYLRELIPASVNLVFRNEMSEEEGHAHFLTSDFLLGNPPVKWFEASLGALKFWQLESAGFDQYRNLSTNAVTANMGDFFAAPCAETVIAGILAFYRDVPRLVKAQTERRWIGKKLRTRLDLLSNKKVVVLGAGAIGLRVKKMLLGFTDHVLVSARTSREADIHSFEELLLVLPETDLVINALPGTADKYVSETFFAAMKRNSIYASVGRGNTTVESALINALESGKLAGAVLDVTLIEPIPADSPLWDMDNVILTQHTGGGQKGENLGKVEQCAANLNRFLIGENVNDEVDLTKGY